MDVPSEVIKASISLGAGVGFARKTCGALTGAALAIGVKYGRSDLAGSRKHCWSRVSSLVERFEANYSTVSCAELTKDYSTSQFSSFERIGRCMEIISFATREAAVFLNHLNNTFTDPEKESYFMRREKT